MFKEKWIEIFGSADLMNRLLLRVPVDLHKVLHAKGYKIRGGFWNRLWKDFFDKNSNATPRQVLEYLRKILVEVLEMTDEEARELISRLGRL